MTDGDNSVRYFDWVEYLHARVRVEVVRFDHDPTNPMGHDITEEGLHMDVYRDAEKVRVKDDFPSVPLTYAPRYCIAYIQHHADRLLHRFEQWHDLNQDPTGMGDP